MSDDTVIILYELILNDATYGTLNAANVLG